MTGTTTGVTIIFGTILLLLASFVKSSPIVPKSKLHTSVEQPDSRIWPIAASGKPYEGGSAGCDGVLHLPDLNGQVIEKYIDILFSFLDDGIDISNDLMPSEGQDEEEPDSEAFVKVLAHLDELRKRSDGLESNDLTSLEDRSNESIGTSADYDTLIGLLDNLTQDEKEKLAKRHNFAMICFNMNPKTLSGAGTPRRDLTLRCQSEKGYYCDWLGFMKYKTRDANCDLFCICRNLYPAPNCIKQPINRKIDCLKARASTESPDVPQLQARAIEDLSTLSAGLTVETGLAEDVDLTRRHSWTLACYDSFPSKLVNTAKLDTSLGRYCLAQGMSCDGAGHILTSKASRPDQYLREPLTQEAGTRRAMHESVPMREHEP